MLQRAQKAVAAVPKDLLVRTAAFLLLKDSRSSFAIEGERPTQDRIRRWGQAIAEAGRRPIDLEELLRLQAIVIGDARFVKLGLREEGGFVGGHDREIRMPIPGHISARPQDLAFLIDGMLAFDRRAAQALDPVIAAAALAFGFVYVHPFVDGNGRIHRYLIHHVLAQRGFHPGGYSPRSTGARQLTATSRFRMTQQISTGSSDATPHAEFLYACVGKTIEENLPRETTFLAHYDQFRNRVEAIVDMPDRTIDLLFRLLHQNGGKLPQRARQQEFAPLTEAEAVAAEIAY